MTKLTFQEFVYGKYDLELSIGFDAAQSDGARYESKSQWFKDQNLESEIVDCGGDPVADHIEWSKLLEEPCEHTHVDMMRGCEDCSAPWHEVRDTDPDEFDR